MKLRFRRRSVRYWTGSLLWYFIEPFAQGLVRGLVDEDDLAVEIRYLQDEIDTLDSQVWKRLDALE